MMHQEIRPDRSRRAALDWRVGLVAVAGSASAGLLTWLADDPRIGLAFLAVFAALASLLLLLPRRPGEVGQPLPAPRLDAPLLDAALEGGAPAALTDREGALVAANAAYQDAFPDSPAPLRLTDRLADAARQAWRDGEDGGSIALADGHWRFRCTRVGAGQDHLLWRFEDRGAGPVDDALKLLTGGWGGVLGASGVAGALVDGQGQLLAANEAFRVRAGAGEPGFPFTDLLFEGEDGRLRYALEGPSAAPLRPVLVPVDDGGTALFFLLDESEAQNGADAEASFGQLLGILPLGLALGDQDGRLLYMNDAFRRAAGIALKAEVAWPSDLVVSEDKAAVADAVRRFARGAPTTADIAIHLEARPSEPVALTLAGTRGLGQAAVLLLLKDNTEEARLKAQVAQATKMQAVGQLAGGVAHDFNNILTAIIGHCDLMLMRHTPGDSDYDDIQQIKGNSNRAASLTRQLLAFSRQQTLRPQVLQLPDVVSEVSHLLKRLMGERIQLQVKHGRSLGAVRADPGQLEQVIINLAVNGRDAMLAKAAEGEGGPESNRAGTLTIQTYAVSAGRVRDIGSDILPVADYTALSVTDTGTGIPPELLGKIFEPFFTTKEVGKGTGLGLSTVYGIVKQSGGFIFADSKPGRGTTFTIYLPVHHAAEPVAPVAPKVEPDELWGSGTVLLVEDEAMVRAVAERALTRHGYTVITANNGEEAVEIIERGDPFDLLVSDVMMPGLDGPATAREARRLRPDVPVLFMSGYAEEQLRKNIDLPNVQFLPKPFSVQQLAEAVKGVLAA